MNILVVEDEKDIQKIIKLYLENDGFTVMLANNGEQGLNVLYENKIDLTIVDWMMPKMNGIDFCKKVRKLNIPTKLIMLTAKSEHEDEIVGLTHGADDYIKKPFDPKILLLQIKKILQYITTHIGIGYSLEDSI